MYEIGAGGVSTGTGRKKTSVAATSSAKTTRQASAAAKAASKLSRATASTVKYVRKLTRSLNTLCSFDEINRLNKIMTTKKSSGSSGRSGSGRSSSRRSGSGSRTKSVKWLEKLKKLLSQVGKQLRTLWKMKKWKVPDSVSELVKLGGQLAALLAGGLKKGYENVLKPIGQWTLQEGLPALVTALGGAFDLVTAALELLSPVGEAVWSNFLQPLGQWAGNAAVTALEGIGGGFSTLAEQLAGLREQLAGSSVIELLGQIGGGLAELLGDGILGGLASLGSEISQWFGEKVAAPIGNTVLNVGIALAKTPAQLWSSFQEGWGNNRAVQALVTLAKSGWSSISGWLGSAPSLESAVKLAKSGWSSISGWLGNAPTLNAGVKLVKKGWSSLSSFIGSFTKTIGLKLSWKTSGLSKIQKTVAKALFGSEKWPTLKFAARGGIVSAATLLGSTVVGEAGTEAIVPLENHTEWLDKVADRLAQKLGGGGSAQDIQITVELDGQKVGQSVVRYCNGVARRTGTHPMSAYL